MTRYCGGRHGRSARNESEGEGEEGGVREDRKLTRSTMVPTAMRGGVGSDDIDDEHGGRRRGRWCRCRRLGAPQLNSFDEATQHSEAKLQSMSGKHGEVSIGGGRRNTAT